MISVGDYVVRVRRPPLSCSCDKRATQGRIPIGSVQRVAAITPNCRCESGFAIQLVGIENTAPNRGWCRGFFRKVDTAEPCEAEFVTLLKRSRQLADVSTAQGVGDAFGPGSRASHGTSLPPSGLRSVNACQRRNLLKLADYLESLPKNYRHFDMEGYADHCGGCALPMPTDMFAAKRPHDFLANCGTVACAVGHGPAAGIPLRPNEFDLKYKSVRWYKYADRAFGANEVIEKTDDEIFELFDFLFASDWAATDNHHYGAAARIRYFLDTGAALDSSRASVAKYAPYRKGTKARRVRDRSGEAVETAKTGSTVGKSPAPAGGDAQP